MKPAAVKVSYSWASGPPENNENSTAKNRGIGGHCPPYNNLLVIKQFGAKELPSISIFLRLTLRLYTSA
jgi:hypothetical protein